MKKLWFLIPCIALVLIVGGLWFRHYLSQPKTGYLEIKPTVTLDCGNRLFQPEGWCQGWVVEYRDGKTVLENSSYPDPLSKEVDHPTLSLERPLIDYSFFIAPKSICVERWQITALDTPEPQSEAVVFSTETERTGTFTAEKGSLYCLTGQWKSGSVHYYFITQ